MERLCSPGCSCCPPSFGAAMECGPCEDEGEEDITGRVCGFPRGRGARPRGKEAFLVELQQPAALDRYDAAAVHLVLRVPLQEPASAALDAKALLHELRLGDCVYARGPRSKVTAFRVVELWPGPGAFHGTQQHLDATEGPKPGRPRHVAPPDAAPHRDRGEVFVAWAEETFGLDALRRAGVLDVAGGSGDVAFALWARGVASLTLDPRPVRMTRRKLHLLRERGVVPAKGGGAAAWVREHLPQRQELLDAGTLAEPGLFAGRVLLGMHPDQATGALLEAALRYGRPFAVVPCCVFAREFPDRALPGGAPVESYEDLVAWLIAHDPERIRTARLPFAGRNLLLYRLEAGSRTPSSEEGIPELLPTGNGDEHFRSK